MGKSRSSLQVLPPDPIAESSERSPLLSQSHQQQNHQHDHDEIEDFDEDAVRNLIGWNSKAGWVGRLRAIVLIASIGMLTFCLAVNMSVITTTQSAIAHEFDCFEHVIWLVTSYLISTSLTNPLSGRIISILTPRYAALTFSTVFAAGTVVVSTAPDFVTFLVGRCIQGAAGGGVGTLLAILVLEFTSTKRRGFWMGFANSGFTVGVSLGGVIGGAALSSPRGWREAFYFQVPVTFVAGIFACLAIPSRHTQREEGESWLQGVSAQLSQIDFAGILTLTPFTLSLLLGLTVPTLDIRYLIPIGLVSLILFLLIERRKPAEIAIIPFQLLISRAVFLNSVSTLLAMCSRWILLFYTPMYATVLLALSPTSAGASVIPASFGFAMGSIITGLIMTHLKTFYIATLAALTIFTATLFSMQFLIFQPTKDLIGLILLSFANGLATGAALNSSLAHLLQSLPYNKGEVRTVAETRAHARIATGVFTTFRTFAGSFGASLGGGVFVRVLSTELSKRGFAMEEVRRLVGSPALVSQLEGMEKAQARESYEVAMYNVLMVSVVLGVASMVTLAGTYKKHLGRRPSAW